MKTKMPKVPTQKDWVKVKKMDSEESRELLDLTLAETRKIHEAKEKRDRKTMEGIGLNIETSQAMITRPLKRKK